MSWVWNPLTCYLFKSIYNQRTTIFTSTTKDGSKGQFGVFQKAVIWRLWKDSETFKPYFNVSAVVVTIGEDYTTSCLLLLLQYIWKNRKMPASCNISGLFEKQSLGSICGYFPFAETCVKHFFLKLHYI